MNSSTEGLCALPMSPAQQRLWFLDQMDPGSTIFNIPVALRLTGPLRVDALRTAFSALIERHEVLRTTLASKAGEPMQVIHPFRAPEIVVYDFSNLAPEAREPALLRELRATAAQTFDLAAGPLLRLRLWKLSNDEHVLMIVLHHAIADGWSLGVLYREVALIYGAALAGKAPALAELPIQYADYAQWHRARMASGELDRQREYWLRQLQGYPGFLSLPTDHPRPANHTFDASDYGFRFPERLTDSLKGFCQELGVTLFMSTITAYAVLLSRYSGQQDLCVGTPVAGRSEAELEDLIGFFVNGLVIRFRFNPHSTLREAVQTVRQTVLDGFANQDLSVDSLFESLKLPRNPAYEPLVQCTFALQNFPRRAEALDDLDVSPVPIECMHSRYDLMLLLMETPESIAGNMVYNSRLFERSTIVRMMGHLEQIVEAMCSRPDAPLDALAFVSPGELYTVLGLDPGQYESILPLNAMQRDLYMDALAHPESPQNTIGGAFELHEAISIEEWTRALDRLTEQQPVLRTRLHASPVAWTEPVYQAILRRDSPRIEVLDWSDRMLVDASMQEALRVALSDFIRQPFPIHGPLVRHVLIQLAPAHWVAVLINHHLLLDGIAAANVLLWLADSCGHRSPIALPPDAFHEQLAASRLTTDTAPLLTWWQERLSGVTPSLCPGAARGGIGDATVSRQHRRRIIPPELWESIRHFSRQQRVTPQIFLKSVFSLLADSHGQCPGDLLIQEFISGRGPGHGAALGCYYQAQPFVAPRALLSASSSFADLLAHTRNWQKEASQHTGLSILEQRRLAPLGRTTFMFNYITARLEVMVGEGSTEILRFTPYADGFVQFEISISGDVVQMGLNYDPHLFAEAGFLERMENVCWQLLAADPCRPLSEISYRLPGEDWATTTTALPQFVSLPAQIAARARQCREAVAIVQGESRLTYAQLLARATALAGQLSAIGAGRGERVGICLPRSPDMIVALLAVLQCGAAYVPMDTSYPLERLQRIAGDAECCLILTHGALRPRLRLATCPLWALDEAAPPLSTVSTAPIVPQRRADDAFYVLYTSGSTGMPKGAVICDGSVANLVNWYRREFAIGADDRLFILSAFGFDLTQKNFFAALSTGATLVLPECPEFDPARLRAEIASQRATLVNCAPSAFLSLLDDPAQFSALGSLRLVFLGGEPIPVARLAGWLRHTDCHAQVVNTYGPTECTDVVAFFRLEDPLADLQQDVPIGYPVDHARLYVIDDAGREVPPFGVGELCIGGLCVGPGYWRDDILTQQRFVEQNLAGSMQRLYRTGDLAWRRRDGLPVFLGRKDFQVKVRGLRIELGEIESALVDLIGGEWQVLAIDDRITAFVRGIPVPPSLAAVRDRLANRLPDYMLPNALVSVATWPLGAHGKVDRQALMQMESTQVSRAVEVPVTATEQRLARIWSEALGDREFDRHDSFFSIGGHSLLAARVVARLRSEFKLDLPLRALFDHPTLAGLGAHIDALLTPAEDDQLTELMTATANLTASELDALLSEFDT